MDSSCPMLYAIPTWPTFVTRNQATDRTTHLHNSIKSPRTTTVKDHYLNNHYLNNNPTPLRIQLAQVSNPVHQTDTQEVFGGCCCLENCHQLWIYLSTQLTPVLTPVRLSYLHVQFRDILHAEITAQDWEELMKHTPTPFAKCSYS